MPACVSTLPRMDCRLRAHAARSLLGLVLVTACAPTAPAASPTPVPATGAAVTSIAATAAASPPSSPVVKPEVSPAASPAAGPGAAVKPAASPAASPAVASASPSPSAAARSTADLTGVWQWESTQPASGAAVLVSDPKRYTITFAPDGTVQVKADCNQVGGTYTVSGSSLAITLGPATLVACPPDSQADAFVAGLNQVTSFTVTASSLELGLSGGGRMVFAPSTQPELVGPLWKLTAYNNGRGALQSVLEGTQPTAVFEASGVVTGSGGCNTYSAPFQSTSTSLSIGPIAATRMACEQATMDQETAYFAALERTSVYRFESGRLVLVESGGARQAEYDL